MSRREQTMIFNVSTWVIKRVAKVRGGGLWRKTEQNSDLLWRTRGIRFPVCS